MTCMMPIAPALDVMGFLSSSCVRPPLSMRMTALIQASATPKRREASWMRGTQRSTSCAGLSARSFSNTDRVAEATAAVGLENALLESPNKLAARTGKNSNFTTLRVGHATINHPVFRVQRIDKKERPRPKLEVPGIWSSNDDKLLAGPAVHGLAWLKVARASCDREVRARLRLRCRVALGSAANATQRRPKSRANFRWRDSQAGRINQPLSPLARRVARTGGCRAS